VPTWVGRGVGTSAEPESNRYKGLKLQGGELVGNIFPQFFASCHQFLVNQFRYFIRTEYHDTTVRICNAKFNAPPYTEKVKDNIISFKYV